MAGTAAAAAVTLLWPERIRSSVCGYLLKRMGTDRHGRGSGEFVSPTQIAVSDRGILVLDAEGTRIQVLEVSTGATSPTLALATGQGGRESMRPKKDGSPALAWVSH